MHNRTRIMRIQNRWIFQPFPLIAFAPLAVLVSVLMQPANDTSQNLGKWLISSSLSYVVFCCILALYYFYFLRQRLSETSSIFIVSSVAAFAGASKGAYVSLSAYEFGLIPTLHSDLALRMISSSLIGAVAIPISAYTYAEIARLRRLREMRLQELTNTQSERVASDALYSQLSQQTRSAVSLELESDIKSALLAFESQIPTGAQLDSALLQLTSASRKQLEKISDQVEAQLEVEFPPLSLRQLLAYTLKHNPFPTITMTLIMLISTPGFILASDLDSHIFHRVGILTGCTLVGGIVGNLIFTFLKQGLLIAWVAILTLTAVSPFVINMVLHGDHIGERLGPIAIYVAWLIVITTATSLARSFFIQRRRVEEDLLDSIDVNRVQEQAAKNVNRALLNDLATYVHGRVQSRLMASAMNISLAEKSEDQDRISKEIASIRSLANDPLENFQNNSPINLHGLIVDLAQTWSGLLIVHYSPDEFKHVPQQAANRISTLVEEGLLNAFRHGHASEATVTIRRDEEQVTIIIMDDGVGPQSGTPSHGSALFDSICSYWNLGPGHEGIGARLTLHISLT